MLYCKVVKSKPFNCLRGIATLSRGATLTTLSLLPSEMGYTIKVEPFSERDWCFQFCECVYYSQDSFVLEFVSQLVDLSLYQRY